MYKNQYLKVSVHLEELRSLELLQLLISQSFSLNFTEAMKTIIWNL